MKRPAPDKVEHSGLAEQALFLHAATWMCRIMSLNKCIEEV